MREKLAYFGLWAQIWVIAYLVPEFLAGYLADYMEWELDTLTRIKLWRRGF